MAKRAPLLSGKQLDDAPEIGGDMMYTRGSLLADYITGGISEGTRHLPIDVSSSWIDVLSKSCNSNIFRFELSLRSRSVN